MTGRHDEALRDFDRALTVDPDSVWTRDSRARLLMDIGRYADAIAEWTAIIESAPGSVAFTQRGECLLKLSRYEAAIADFDRGIAADSANVDAERNRAAAFTALGRPQTNA